MKKLLLPTFLLLLTSSYGQQLTNTDWNVYDTNNNFIDVFSFDADSMSYAGGLPWLKVAGYTESGNSFWITDNHEIDCDGGVGQYTFLVQNDTLIFTIVDDTCTSRSLLFADFTWVGILTNIDELMSSSLSLYPNPTTGQLSISLEEAKTGVLRVLNSLGQVVLEDDFKGVTELILSLDGPSGLYFIQLEVDGQVITKKVVKE